MRFFPAQGLQEKVSERRKLREIHLEDQREEGYLSIKQEINKGLDFRKLRVV